MEKVKDNPNRETSIPEDSKQITSFLIEEFKENWTYIRHIEEIRLKHTDIFLIITGAVISVFSFMIKFQDNNMIQQSFSVLLKIIIIQYGGPIIAGSGFIFLYGFFLGRFLALQKKGYEHYRKVNAEIRNWFTKNSEYQFSFEMKLPTKSSMQEVIKSPFFHWYLLVVLINVFAFMVLSLAILGLMAPHWSLKYTLILSVVLSVCIFIIECHQFIKINKTIEIGPG